MTEKFVDSMSTSQEIASLRRGIKLKNEAYTNNVLLIMIKQLEKGGELASNYINSSGVCSLIEHLFETFRSSKPIVLNALVILNYFISITSGSSSSSSTLSKHLLTRTDPCCGLISSIALHILDQETVNESVRLLLFLTSEENLLRKLLYHQNQRMKSVASDVDNCDDLSSVGISDVILKVVRIYCDDTRLMEVVCHIIYNLAYDQDENTSDECRSYLSFLGFNKFLVEGILKHSKPVLTFSTVSSTSSEEIVTSVSKTSPTEVPHHNTMQDSVGNNLVNDINADHVKVITSSEHLTHRTTTPSSGESDGNGIHKEGSNCTIQSINFGLAKWGLRALGALCREHDSNQQAFFELGACDVVMHLNECKHAAQS